MIDTKELRRLAQAVIGWGCCNQAWLDQSEDTPAAVVGHINEDGETYPVVTIDCDQYSAAGQSLPLGKFYAAANPAVINELLPRLEAAESVLKDFGTTAQEVECWLERYRCIEREAEALRTRLEAAEADALEQARLNGMGGEREAALMAKLEAAEKERDDLRAKIDEMEKQEPVAWLHETRPDSDVVTSAVKHVWGKAVVGALAAYSIPLYLAPGAKGE